MFESRISYYRVQERVIAKEIADSKAEFGATEDKFGVSYLKYMKAQDDRKDLIASISFLDMMRTVIHFLICVTGLLYICSVVNFLLLTLRCAKILDYP